MLASSVSYSAPSPVGDLRELVHQLNNSLQCAVGTAELLDFELGQAPTLSDLRGDVAAVLDRLDEAGQLLMRVHGLMARQSGWALPRGDWP